MRAGLSAFLVFIATGVSAEAPAVPQVRGASLTVETHDRKPDLKEFNPGQCFPIRAIHIHGIEVIDVNAVKQAVEPLAYHCLDNALAGALVLAVNKVHADAGFITTQGALPDQDIRKEKTLTINVYTGTIGRILYEEPETDEDPPLFTRLGNRWTAMRKADGIWRGIQGVSDLIDTLDDPLDRFQLLDGRRFNGLKPWTSFMNKPGDVLHLDRIQRDADNLNRVSSNKAEVKLKAGERPATSDVVFTNPQRDSFRLQVGYERNGTALNNTGSTVDQRVRFDMAKDNLIGINDSWRGVFAGGINTNEATLSLGIPWRRFNFGVNGSYSESLSDIMQGVELMQRTGIVTATLGASLEKTSRVQSSMDASLMWRLSERHINGAALTDQS
ncbi:MAG: hypothetical protein LBR29_10855, partial [Methylobacteriaceae bacterium]|nr:hypothetical protein [Methylobacteriaceae bacterium]